MIPFEELSLALAAWRVKNDLPITEQDQAALQATLGAAMPPQDYTAENLAGANYGQGEAIADQPTPTPEMDGVPAVPGTGDGMPAYAQDGMSEEMQITDSQLVSTDDPPTDATAPPVPEGAGDFDIDLDE